jgi:hypothetical protein
MKCSSAKLAVAISAHANRIAARNAVSVSTYHFDGAMSAQSWICII